MDKMSPPVSIGLGLALGALVGLMYQHGLPSLIDHRVGDQDDEIAAKAERTITRTTALLVTGVALLAKDPTVFVMGGASVVGFALLHKHANMVNPLTGRATAPAAIAADNDLSPDMVYDTGED